MPKTLEERAYNAKLTYCQADRIRHSCLPSREIAMYFGVSHTTVLDIKRGRRYAE